MGAGSSVRANANNYRSNVKKDTNRNDDVDCGSASKFDAFANHLASNYHNRRLSVGNPLSDSTTPIPAGAVPPADSVKKGLAQGGRPLKSRSLPPPRPRAERKKLSREQLRYVVDDGGGEAGVKQGHEEKSVRVDVASPDRQGRGDGIVRRPRSHRMNPSEIEDLEELITANYLKRGPPGKGQGQFVERGEIAGLARDLGFDITPVQATQLFDMLDPLGQGRIAKDDLLKHSIPLLQRAERVGLTEDGLGGRRGSAFKPPRRPRPACPPPDTAAPPRPSGEPPPTAKRWVPSALSGDRRVSATASLRPIVSSSVEKRPANFWVAARGSDGDVACLNRASDNEKKKLGRANLGEDANRREVVVEGSANAFAHGGSQTEGNVERVEGANREGARVSGIVRVDEGTRADKGGNVVVAPLPTALTCEGSEEGVRHRETRSGDGPRGSPDQGCGDNHAGYHSTSDTPLVYQRTSGATAGTEQGQCTTTTGVTTSALSLTTPATSPGDTLAGKDILTWTATDVRVWLRALPRGLAAFAEARAFSDGSVDGKRLATITLSGLKKKEFHHAKFRAKAPTALWAQIKRIQPIAAPAPAVAVVPASSRFSAGQTIADEATRTPLCTVSQFVGQGAFGEVYKVVWTGVGADWGATLAMKTVRLADITEAERDEYRVLLVEEILTAVRVKPHPNVVNVKFAHIMGFCSENEEYLCFEDFVTGEDLEGLVSEGGGELYRGTTQEVQGRLLSYAIQLARGLGHIHRCGVLHQDIKSANVMVSDDGQMLITDFGFANVGHFGPPPPPPQRPVCADVFPDASPPFEEETLVPATNAARLETERAGGRPIEGEEASAVSINHPASLADNTFRSNSRRPLGSTVLIPDIGHRTENTTNSRGGPYPKENTNSSGDHPSKRERNDAQQRGEVGGSQTDTAEFGLVSAGQVQTVCQNEDVEVDKCHLDCAPDKERPRLLADCTIGGLDEETDAAVPTAEKVEQRGTDIGTAVPGHSCVLFGTLKGLTPRYQSPEVSILMERRASLLRSQAGTRGSQSGVTQHSTAPQARDNGVDGQPPYTHRSDMWAAGVIILEMYAGGLAALRGGRGENASDLLETLVENSRDFPRADEVWQGGCTTGTGCDHKDVRVDAKARGRLRAGGEHGAGGIDLGKKRRSKLRVDMPEKVLELLREMFEREARDRPVSMEAVAARLSQALGRLLEKGLVVVPLPSSDAPSRSSLCEQTPAYVETEENHAKLGRLHMWLGKALFLKGEGRRGQALQEYREGVRVLEESKADQGSPSMALFRWYLGEALLEAGEIEEALPHLTEAVSIDPENAKYRHTLGLAKCVTGDEAGAREDLLEAALLDEEDAEDRYQLRMRRESEARKTLEKRRTRQDSKEGTQQGLSMPSENKATGMLQAVRISKLYAPNTSLRYSSHRQALEYASSPQTYALEKLKEYRTGRGSVRALEAMGVGRGTADAGAIALGDKIIGDGGLLSEVRKFSIGDQISCGKDESTPVKTTDPLRCYPSSLDGGDGGGGTYTISSFLLGEQASLFFRGEAYTATTGQNSEDGIKPGWSYHVVRAGFEQDSWLAALAASTAASATARSRPSAASALNADEELNTVGVGRITGEGPNIFSGRIQNDLSCQPSELSRTFIGSTYMRGGEYIPTLRAAGRAAMVGFHTGLSGALRDLTWGSGELVLVATNIPSDCITLQEALCGSLYRGTATARHVAEEQSLGVQGAADRILTIARQTAEAISHCHCRGVLLQDITPNDVRVTPQWNALLRPNYAHAREGRAWTTVSVRGPQPKTTKSTATQGKSLRSRRMSLSSDDEPLTAPFSDAIRPDYQSPEIAQIRRESRSHVRVSSRALRRSKQSPPPEECREQSSASPTLRSAKPDSASSAEEKRGHDLDFVGDGGDNNSTDDVVSPFGDSSGGGGDLSTKTPVADEQGGTARAAGQRKSCAHDRDLSPPRDSVNSRGSGGQDVSSLDAPAGRGLPTVTPCTSDIWAWALIVLQMFSDEAWPQDSGQEGLLALEALLQRRNGVDTWTIEDVVSWLGDVGLWSENTEREIRTFRIDGRQLLIPTCRRDIMERLGLFITDGELSHKLWENIAGGLQRWTMPPQLPRILRRCLADRPEDRFSTMEEVCTVLRGIATDSGSGNGFTMPTASSTTGGEDEYLDRLRTGMLLNNTGLCLANEGHIEEAKRHYKMALLASQELPEARYNLGLLYSSSAINKFREARQSFEAAAGLMDADDPRRRVSSEHARAAERKSNFYQSEEVMNALSGKYNSSVSPTEPRGKTSNRTAREPRGSEDGDGKRRSTTSPPETFISPPWNSSTARPPLMSPKGTGLAPLPHRSPGLSPKGPGLANLKHCSRTTRKHSLSPL